MSESIAFRLYREQAGALARAAESWQREHKDALAAWQTEDLIRAFLAVSGSLRQWWGSTFRRLMDGEVADLSDVRFAVEDATRTALEAFRVLGATAREVEASTGHRIENLPDLEHARDDLLRLREEALGHWPEFGAPELAQATAAVARGEAIPVDEAFANAAGISKEELLRRLAEHQEKRHAGTGG